MPDLEIYLVATKQQSVSASSDTDLISARLSIRRAGKSRILRRSVTRTPN
ncbi:hypothetical protein N9B13_00130 [Akkermansiaceae bacterium]|nr:hypothetical protein [Akkermansiaceae bacterium]